MARHKHADIIKAWADGAEIEVFELPECRWEPVVSPSWSERLEYRIKPDKKPDDVGYVGIYIEGYGESWKASDVYISCQYVPNEYRGIIRSAIVKLTQCGETGKLIKAEVINHD